MSLLRGLPMDRHSSAVSPTTKCVSGPYLRKFDSSCFYSLFCGAMHNPKRLRFK